MVAGHFCLIADGDAGDGLVALNVAAGRHLRQIVGAVRYDGEPNLNVAEKSLPCCRYERPKLNEFWVVVAA